MLNYKLSVVMPAYNEEKLIYNSIKETIRIVQQFAPDMELIVVNDGSTDKTLLKVMDAANEDNRVKYISYDVNKGKGNAILVGAEQACGEYIAFVDADLELNPVQLEGYLEKMLSDNMDVVIGSKFHRGSKLKYPFSRKIISMGYYLMLMVLFRLDVKDTQTGLKVFRSKPLKEVIPLIKTKGFAYDIELLVALHRRGCRIMSMPVSVVHVRESGSRRITQKAIWRAFCDTWAIFVRCQKHYYD